jgi:hypothetical protein
LIRYNDITLRSTECLLEDILERAPDWEQRSDGERADLYYEWEGIVGRLQGAIDDDRDGILTTEQQQRIRELARRIVATRSVILGIGFPYPDFGHLLANIPMTEEERVEHDLWTVDVGVRRLRALVELGNSPFVSARERLAFPLEWTDIVTLFGKLAGLAQQRKLQPSARAELRRVADELAELLPTMQRLKLRQPDPDVLARARAVEAARRV